MGDTTELKWIIDESRSEVAQTIQDLCRGFRGRILVEGPPRGADRGRVGIYETAPGDELYKEIVAPYDEKTVSSHIANLTPEQIEYAAMRIRRFKQILEKFGL